jgi:hypothetical protein
VKLSSCRIEEVKGHIECVQVCKMQTGISPRGEVETEKVRVNEKVGVVA